MFMALVGVIYNKTFREIWMALHKTALSPVQTHLRYCSFELSHQTFVILQYLIEHNSSNQWRKKYYANKDIPNTLLGIH